MAAALVAAALVAAGLVAAALAVVDMVSGRIGVKDISERRVAS